MFGRKKQICAQQQLEIVTKAVEILIKNIKAIEDYLEIEFIYDRMQKKQEKNNV